MEKKTDNQSKLNNQHTRIPKGPGWKIILAFAVVAPAMLLSGILIGTKRGIDVPRSSDITSASHDHTQHDSGKQYYTCGMHPWVILPQPGDCPICHMELTPLDPAKFTGEIVIDPVIVQNMGVRIAPVTTGPLTRTIRTVGTVDYNERTVRDVNIKVSGWIENLYIDFLGAHVDMGEPLFDLYSPELFTAQEEYLLAWKNQDRVGSPAFPDATKGAASLLEAAKTRLAYFDITEQQIKELHQAGKPSKTMTILSPHTGVVIEKHANEGMKVDPGMRVFRIADLTKVWVMATLYEYQLPYV